MTFGKVLKGWPIIPAEVENFPGFNDAVRFGENSAQTWLEDDDEASSPEFQELLNKTPLEVEHDFDRVNESIASIRSAGVVDATTRAKLQEADNWVRRSKVYIKTVTNPSLRGPERAERLRAWISPNSSLNKLATVLETLKPLCPAFTAELQDEQLSLRKALTDLEQRFQKIHSSPAHQLAYARAEQRIGHAREVIETLRHETNRYSISIVGITDITRLWPDTYGTRYAFGMGARFSLVNVNFTVGYAVNPRPHPELGQGRGATFFSITYSDLFH